MQLVDTNVISELMYKTPDTGVLAWMLATETSQARLLVSVITVHEIVYGLTRKSRPARLAWFEQFLRRVQVLEVNETIARGAGEMRGRLATRGQVRHVADMLIAATAQVHALTLVTRNVRDFDGCGIGLLNPFKG
ncbi:MAG: type II toxin-antitoxin system VapC family toxin [Proteobacteria bacterium]|nr:type II toxin-antitoxin system VapC family toxin [Pseudomonadota bacterium]